MPSIKFVDVVKPTPVDTDVIPLSAIFICPGSDRKVRQADGYEVWDWDVLLEVWCQGIDSEEMIGLIHTAMAVDRGRGTYLSESNAETSYRSDSDIIAIDVDRAIVVLKLGYTVRYSHLIGIP